MKNKFDELTKLLAESVTRRGALKKFGVGLAGMVLACLGLADKPQATTRRGFCVVTFTDFSGGSVYTGSCVSLNGCVSSSSADCPPQGTLAPNGGQLGCGHLYDRRDRA